MKNYGSVEVYTYAFLISTLDGGEWSASRPSRLIPGIHRIEGRVDPRTSLNDVAMRIPAPAVVQLVLTPWSRILLEKLTATQQGNKFSACYGTQNFITLLKSAHVRPCVAFRNKPFFLWRRVVSPSPILQAGGPPIDGRPPR
jgi:hypothetical protein